MTLTVQTKRCLMCGVQKSLDAFSRNHKGRLGREPYCKSCKNPRTRVAVNRLRFRTFVTDAIAAGSVTLVTSEDAVREALTRPEPFYATPPEQEA